MTQILLINQNVKAMIRMRLKLNCLNCNILYLLQKIILIFKLYYHKRKRLGFFFQHTVLSWIKFYNFPQFLKMLISVQISHSVMSDSLWPHGMQHDRLLCPSLTPGVHSNSCPLSLWCHPTISSSVIPFSSRTQSCPASGSFPMSWFFTSSGQSIRPSASASVLSMNI